MRSLFMNELKQMNSISKISKDFSLVLDFCRGLSAQIVLIGHLLAFFNWQGTYNIPIVQNFGVVVFFVLSGFLIVQTTLQKGSGYGLQSYLIDRFSRIYYSFVPALFFIMVIDFIMKIYFSYNDSYEFTFKNFVGNLLQLQSYPVLQNFGIEAYGSARPFWTVAIEWWLYVIFGYLYYQIVNHKKQKLVFFVLFLLSLPVVFQNVLGRGNGLTIMWVAGLCLSLLHNIPGIQIRVKPALGLIFMLILIMGIRMYFYKNMYDVGIAMVFALSLFVLKNAPELLERVCKYPFVQSISKFLASYSYSLYLIHYSIVELSIQILGAQSIWSFITIFLIVNVLAYYFYVFFEKNHHKFRAC